MKKLLIAGMALMIFSTASFAKIGIGYDGYNSAASFKYWTEKFGFQGMVRFAYEGEESSGSGVDYMLIDGTAKFLFPIFKSEKLWLNGVLGIGIQSYSGINHVEDCTKMNTGFLVGLSPE